MASGRPDYWYAMLTGKAVLGSGQRGWLRSKDATIDARATLTVIEYTVPEDYILTIAGGIITAINYGINCLHIYINDILTWRVFFDQEQLMPFNPSSNYILNSGDELKVIVVNKDYVEVEMWVTFFGFEEYRII